MPTRSAPAMALYRLWRAGWGFDWLYDRLLVRPFLWLARINRADFIDASVDALIWLGVWSHRALSLTQTGQVRWYAACVTAGSILLVGLSIWN